MARYTGPNNKQARRVSFSILENGKDIGDENLFMVIIDFMCLITYIILFRKDFKIKKY